MSHLGALDQMVMACCATHDALEPRPLLKLCDWPPLLCVTATRCRHAVALGYLARHSHPVHAAAQCGTIRGIVC